MFQLSCLEAYVKGCCVWVVVHFVGLRWTKLFHEFQYSCPEEHVKDCYVWDDVHVLGCVRQNLSMCLNRAALQQ